MTLWWGDAAPDQRRPCESHARWRAADRHISRYGPVATLRTSLLTASAIRNPPSAVTATQAGLLSWASVAGPSSPLFPAAPVPATRLITPAADTLRTTLLA